MNCAALIQRVCDVADALEHDPATSCGGPDITPECMYCTARALRAQQVPDPDDSAALLAAAEQAIRRTLADGQGKYQPGEWKEHDLLEHYEHGHRHALAWASMSSVRQQIKHINHAITRLCMAKCLLERK